MGSVRLIVVAKTVGVGRIAEAIEGGARVIGENRVQEALPKILSFSHCGKSLAWHFIGQLQRRKVKKILGLFHVIHSVDSIELAQEIDQRAAERGLTQKILLEVNQGAEKNKGGFSQEALDAALPVLDSLPHLDVCGLMTIPPQSPDPEGARPFFRRLRELAGRLTHHSWKRVRMTELSMGMSGDYEVAVEEGATMVRVGTAIFGERHGDGS